MGTFLLCGVKRAEKPYPIPDLGIGLYSAEELCYYMNHYLYLLEEDFLSDELLAFIRDELALPELAAKIVRWAESRSDMLQIVYMIEQDIHYYNDMELNAMKQRLDVLRQADPAERAALRADFCLSDGRPVAALRAYERVLNGEYGERIPRSLRGRVLHNAGVAYTRLFEWKKAMDCFVESCHWEPGEEILKEMYQLTLLDELTEIPQDILSAVSASQQYKWKEEFDTLRRKAAHSGKALEAGAVMEKDSIRRSEGLSKLLGEWKQEYRTMMRE